VATARIGAFLVAKAHCVVAETVRRRFRKKSEPSTT
jgi:hypothetical protein